MSMTIEVFWKNPQSADSDDRFLNGLKASGFHPLVSEGTFRGLADSAVGFHQYDSLKTLSVGEKSTRLFTYNSELRFVVKYSFFAKKSTERQPFLSISKMIIQTYGEMLALINGEVVLFHYVNRNLLTNIDEDIWDNDSIASMGHKPNPCHFSLIR